MQRLFVVLVVLFTLAGCASNPLSEVSNLAEKNLGEVLPAANGRPEYRQATLENETDKLKHWRMYSPRLYRGPELISADMDKHLQYLEQYCSERGGDFGEIRTSNYPQNSMTVKEVTCVGKKTHNAIFKIYTGYSIVHRDVAWTRQPGKCVWLSRDQPGYTDDKPLACSEWIDGFEWKSPGTLDDVDQSYKLLGVYGMATIAEADAYVQGKRDKDIADKAAFERQIQMRIQAKNEEEQRLRERAIRDLPQVKTIGQKICRTIEITQTKRLYQAPVNVQAKITAFTENVSGDKIQLRISGMRAGDENVDRIDGEVVFQNGGVIWDNATNWGLCY